MDRTDWTREFMRRKRGQLLLSYSYFYYDNPVLCTLYPAGREYCDMLILTVTLQVSYASIQFRFHF